MIMIVSIIARIWVRPAVARSIRGAVVGRGAVRAVGAGLQSFQAGVIGRVRGLAADLSAVAAAAGEGRAGCLRRRGHRKHGEGYKGGK